MTRFIAPLSKSTSTIIFSYISLSSTLSIAMLQTQVLRVGQVNEPCIGLTQENSIESSLQSSLPYIPIHMVHASY